MGFGIPASQHSPGQAPSVSSRWRDTKGWAICLSVLPGTGERALKGGTPNIGMPVTQTHGSPGSQSPPHVCSLVKRWLRCPPGSCSGLKRGQSEIYGDEAEGRGERGTADFWIPGPGERQLVRLLNDERCERSAWEGAVGGGWESPGENAGDQSVSSVLPLRSYMIRDKPSTL